MRLADRTLYASFRHRHSDTPHMHSRFLHVSQTAFTINRSSTRALRASDSVWQVHTSRSRVIMVLVLPYSYCRYRREDHTWGTQVCATINGLSTFYDTVLCILLCHCSCFSVSDAPKDIIGGWVTRQLKRDTFTCVANVPLHKMLQERIVSFFMLTIWQVADAIKRFLRDVRCLLSESIFWEFIDEAYIDVHVVSSIPIRAHVHSEVSNNC